MQEYYKDLKYGDVIKISFKGVEYTGLVSLCNYITDNISNLLIIHFPELRDEMLKTCKVGGWPFAKDKQELAYWLNRLILEVKRKEQISECMAMGLGDGNFINLFPNKIQINTAIYEGKNFDNILRSFKEMYFKS